jgi:diguanylate cyclase (GGDEF)-like protein
MGVAPGTPRALRAVGICLAAVWLVFLLHVAFGLAGSGTHTLFNSWVYDGLVLAAALGCLARAALVREDRLAWAVVGLGAAAWFGGELYWTLAFSGVSEPPYPSPADALYLAYYPLAYAGLFLLVHRRVASLSRGLWLDGGIAALAVVSIGVAVVLQPIVAATSGSVAAVATNLAYPLGDLTLMALVIVVFGLSGWRPGRAWVLLGIGFGVTAIADGIFLVQSAKGTYTEGTVLDALWPAGLLLVAYAAWQPAPRRARSEVGGWRMVVVPTGCALVALTLLVGQDLWHPSRAAIVLAGATLVLVTARMSLSFLDNQRMLVASRHEALTDALTSLGNRRRLMADLESALEAAGPADPRLVVLFDLNGFKRYNDTFGHPAGDELLSRLGRRLAEAVRPTGLAYRLGGDEFCAIVRPTVAGTDIVARAAAALRERGEGFAIDASHGVVELAVEALDVREALQLADRRMYRDKGSGRASASRQTRDVLLETLRERQPELHVHLRDVADLATAVGRRLEMGPEELDEVARAAELHDVGKMAIPDAILHKAGPLEEDEWSFMRRHTVIGERILAAAPALVPVARIVRSSHERFDGRGYPDGLSGDDIPLGARIVAVCDAFDAMTSDRAYRAALTRDQALAELNRESGRQFDPLVVEAFLRTAGVVLDPAPA